ncbi:hypothetical protein MXB_5048 [Myxobolus squamalis]|nr:hypothetical protein MXB_5048 [Myxobolus squamalis]
MKDTSVVKKIKTTTAMIPGPKTRILESHVNWVNRIQTLYIDRTFSLTPSLFSQIFFIITKRNKFVFTILYALLPNKNTNTCIRLFEYIKTFWPNFSLTNISMDFKQAAICAIFTIFPNENVNKCFFHLRKNMTRKLSDEGLLQ